MNKLARILHWLLVALGLAFLAAGARAQNPVGNAMSGQVSAAWTSATAGGASGARLLIPMAGFSTATIDFTVSGSLTGGVITFEGTTDPNGNVNWKTIPCSRGGSTPSSDSTYTLTGANQLWQCSGAGLQYLSARLSTAITGTGTANLTGQATSAESKWFSVAIAPPTTNGVSVEVIGASDNSNPFVPVTPRVTSVNNMNASSATNPGGALAGNGYLITTAPNKFWQTNNVGSGSAAAVTFSAPGAGKSWVVDCIQYAITAIEGTTVTAAASMSVSVADGTPTTYFTRTFSVPPVASCTSAGNCVIIAEQPIVCGLGIVGAPNQTMTVSVNTGITNGRESVAAGAYIIQ